MLHVARTKRHILETLEQHGVLDALGGENLFDDVHEAVEAIRSRSAGVEQAMAGTDGGGE